MKTKIRVLFLLAVSSILGALPAVAAPQMAVANLCDLAGKIYGVELTFSDLGDGVYPLYCAFGKSDRGTVLQSWPRVDFIQNVMAANTSLTYEFPDGWGVDFTLARFFIFESDKHGEEVPVEYLMNDRVYNDTAAGTGVGPFINTGKYPAAGQILEVVWANETEVDGYNSENKSWAFGRDGLTHMEGCGGRTYTYNNQLQIIPWLMGANAPFSPTPLAAEVRAHQQFRDVLTIGVETTTFVMTRLEDGQEFAIVPVATPSGASFKANLPLCLFSDTINSTEGKQYIGRKRIYSAKLTEIDSGNLLMNLEPRILNGKPGFRDTVSGDFFTNASSCGWDFKTAPVDADASVASAVTAPIDYSATAMPDGNVTIVTAGDSARAVFKVENAAADIYFICFGDAAVLNAHDLAWGSAAATGVEPGTVHELAIDGLAAGTTYYYACRFVNGDLESPVRRGSFTIAAPRELSVECSGSDGEGGFTVTVGPGATADRLLAAYGSANAGDAVGSWPKLVYVATVDAAGGVFAVSAPAEWGTTYRRARFFLVSSPYDTAVEYVSSYGVGKKQSVNIVEHLKIGRTFSVDWAMETLDGAETQTETKGWGANRSAALNICGSRLMKDSLEFRPYIYGDNRTFNPAAKSSIAPVGNKITDTVAIGDEWTTFTMRKLKDGSIYAIDPLPTPADYDSGAAICLFSDSTEPDVNGYAYPYHGVRRIYAATLTERTEDAAVSNDVARIVPVSVNGVGAMYDEITGQLRENTDSASTLAVGKPVGTAYVQSGVSPLCAFAVAGVRLSACPAADGKMLIAAVVEDVGEEATWAQLQIGWGLAGNAIEPSVTTGRLGAGKIAIVEAKGCENGAVYEVVCRSTNDLDERSEVRELLWFDARSVTCTPEKPARGATSVELSFAASDKASTLYACLGTSDCGGDWRDWEFAESIAVEAGVESIAYTLPAQWGRVFTRLRFIFANDSIYPVQYIESTEGGRNNTKANYIDTGVKFACGQKIEVEWANTRAGGFDTLGENKGWGMAGKHAFSAGGRIWQANWDEVPSTLVAYDHVCAYLTAVKDADGVYGHAPFRDDAGVALAASDVLPFVYYRDTFTAGETEYAMTTTNLSTGVGYSCSRTLDLGGASWQADANIFLFGDAGDCNYPGWKRIRSARLTGGDSQLVFNLLPFAKNGESAFFDTVSRTWKTRVYAARADLTPGPAKNQRGALHGTSPLIRAVGNGMIILVR